MSVEEDLLHILHGEILLAGVKTGFSPNRLGDIPNFQLELSL